MAEMTAAEALGILGGSEKQPQSEQELITSIIAGMTRGEKCFVLLWDSERVQLAALIEQQAAEIARKDRMLNKACKRLSMTNMSIRTEKQWLAWLEKEEQGVE